MTTFIATAQTKEKEKVEYSRLLLTDEWREKRSRTLDQGRYKTSFTKWMVSETRRKSIYLNGELCFKTQQRLIFGTYLPDLSDVGYELDKTNKTIIHIKKAQGAGTVVVNYMVI